MTEQEQTEEIERLKAVYSSHLAVHQKINTTQYSVPDDDALEKYYLLAIDVIHKCETGRIKYEDMLTECGLIQQKIQFLKGY